MNNGEKYCLITGASNGIGKALAEECTKRNMNLFLIALPDSGLEDIAKNLSTHNGNSIICFTIDLTGKNAPLQVYEYAKKHNLIIDIIINNAGVGGYGFLENHKPEEIDSMIMLNIRATTLLTYYFLSDLKKLPKANILNISSFAAFIPMAKKSIYAATKSYILFFSRSLNAELKGTNVSVTSIHPSGVTTNSRVKRTIQNAHMMAQIATLDPQKVAKIAVDGMLKGKKLIAPGFATRFFYILGSILPYGIIVKIVGWIFRKAS